MREDQSLNARTNRLRLASICLFAALLGGCGANAPSARDDQNSGGRAGTSGGGGDRGAPAGSGGAGGAKAGGSGGAPADGAHPVDDASDDAESVATPDGGSDDSALVPPPPVGPIAIPTSYPTGTGSAGVAQGPSGKLVYTFDTSGDTVPDFSNVGYQGGGVKIPTVRVVTTLAPLPGENDASARIQAAIDALAKMPLGNDGFRGALLLQKGIYPLQKGLVIQASGIVVYGEGDDPQGTVMRITAGAAGSAVIVFRITDGGKSPVEVTGTRHTITEPYVPLGAKWFHVDSTEGLAVGDQVIVARPSTSEWIDALGMGPFGWKAGDYDMKFDRRIVAISDDRIMLDAPIVQSLDKKYGGGVIYKYDYPGRVQNVGIEKIRAESTVAHPDGLNTVGNFVDVDGLANGWFSHLTNAFLQGSPMRLRAAKWITVEDMVSVHKPWPGAHSGASPSVFTFDDCQLLLFQRLTSSDGGFEFSSGGRNPGPNVYVDSTVPHGYAFSGPHQRWANATLYDHLVLAQDLAVFNAGGAGSGHGWEGANHMLWNIQAPGIRCEKPPTAHQWVVGAVAGSKSGDCDWVSFGKPVAPESLHHQQLIERLGSAALANIAKRN
jgi:hypothetical protein